MGPYASLVEPLYPPPVPAYPAPGRQPSQAGKVIFEKIRGTNDAIAVSAGPARRRRRRAGASALVIVLVAGLAGAGWFTISHFAHAVPDDAADLRAMASSINLQLVDVPPTWQVDTTTTTSRPAPSAGSTSRTAANTAAQQFAQCADITPSEAAALTGDNLPDGGVTEASASFSDNPGDGTDVSSNASILPLSSEVSAALAVVNKPQFAACEQQFLMSVLRLAVPSGVTVAAGGAAVAMALPSGYGVNGTIVSAPVDLIGSSGHKTIYTESAFMTAGRVESELTSDTVGLPLGTSLYQSLVGVVADRTGVVARQHRFGQRRSGGPERRLAAVCRPLAALSRSSHDRHGPVGGLGRYRSLRGAAGWP